MLPSLLHSLTSSEDNCYLPAHVVFVKLATELYYVKIHSISLFNSHTISTADYIRPLEHHRRALFPNSRYYRLRISEHDRWSTQLMVFIWPRVFSTWNGRGVMSSPCCLRLPDFNFWTHLPTLTKCGMNVYDNLVILISYTQ